MKIKKEHLTTINEKINAFLLVNPTLPFSYENGNFKNSDRVKDLQTRFNFDVFYMSKCDAYVRGIENQYDFLYDKHIESALKSICPKITKKY
jgi:hypothetical protein